MCLNTWATSQPLFCFSIVFHSRSVHNFAVVDPVVLEFLAAMASDQLRHFRHVISCPTLSVCMLLLLVLLNIRDYYFV